MPGPSKVPAFWSPLARYFAMATNAVVVFDPGH